MDKVVRVPTPRKGKVDIYDVASDWHDRHSDPASIDILIQFAQLRQRKDRKLIIPGDFLDLAEFMPRSPLYKQWIKRSDGVEEFFLPAVNEAFGWGNEMLDRLQKTYEEIILMGGNHEYRLVEFARVLNNSLPAYSHNFDLQVGLNLRSRGIKYVPYNHWLDIGNVTITHGMYHGTTCLKRHYEAAGKSVIFGHVHMDDVKSFTRRGDTVKAWSLPCMSTLAPEYLKSRENNWTNGFGVLRMKSNGRFNFHVHTVWDNQLVLESGKILSS